MSLEIFGDYLQDQGHPLGRYLSEGRAQARHSMPDFARGIKNPGPYFNDIRIEKGEKPNTVWVSAQPHTSLKLPPFAVELTAKEWLQSRLKPSVSRRDRLIKNEAWDGYSRYLKKAGHPLAPYMRPEEHEDTDPAETGIDWDTEGMKRAETLEKHGLEKVGILGDDVYIKLPGHYMRRIPGAAKALKLASSIIMKVPLPTPIETSNRSYVLP